MCVCFLCVCFPPYRAWLMLFDAFSYVRLLFCFCGIDVLVGFSVGYIFSVAFFSWRSRSRSPGLAVPLSIAFGLEALSWCPLCGECLVVLPLPGCGRGLYSAGASSSGRSRSGTSSRVGHLGLGDVPSAAWWSPCCVLGSRSFSERRFDGRHWWHRSHRCGSPSCWSWYHHSS